jgi:hypothetical protein
MMPFSKQLGGATNWVNKGKLNAYKWAVTATSDSSGQQATVNIGLDGIAGNIVALDECTFSANGQYGQINIHTVGSIVGSIDISQTVWTANDGGTMDFDINSDVEMSGSRFENDGAELNILSSGTWEFNNGGIYTSSCGTTALFNSGELYGDGWFVTCECDAGDGSVGIYNHGVIRFREPFIEGVSASELTSIGPGESKLFPQGEFCTIEILNSIDGTIEVEGAQPDSLCLTPVSATNQVGSSHELTATLVDATGAGICDEMITFSVMDGPHVGTTGTDVTDANGEATWSYTGTSVGTDTIVATDAGISSNEAYKTWEIIGALTVESADSSGGIKDIFQPGESVYAIGGGYDASTAYDLYIVVDTTWTDGMDIPDRVADTDTSVTTDASGNIAPGTRIWTSSVQGKYDIVVDVNVNGRYDASTDALDANIDVGFEAVPEFSTIAIPVASILGLLFFFNHCKRRREQ